MVGLWVAAAQSHAQAPAVRTVQVTAERFSFTPSEVSIAVGDEVDFRLKSEDTAHGFRILGQPIDVAIPKRGRGEIVVRFAPPRAGTYIFECSRMCGAGHSFMRGTINVKDVPEVRSR
jgi:cytochrome c oxidase subunit 2